MPPKRITIEEEAMSQPKHTLILLPCAAGLMLSLSACSITETINNILSSTSGRSWFTEDGLVKENQKVNAFMAFNFENVKQDMANGQGEYLDSLSALMGIPQDRRAAFYAHAQSRYPFVLEHQSNPQETLALLVTNSEGSATVHR
jgi:Protein of unknown function (DUF3015)